MPINTLEGLVATTGNLLTEAAISASSSGDNTIVTGTAGKRVKVYVFDFVVSGDTDIIFKSGSTALSGTYTMYGGGSLTRELSGYWWFITAAGENFIINSSNAVTIGGTIKYQIS